MSIKLLIDMNLSPRWTEMLRSHGWEAAHWSEIGDPGAPDRTIIDWARTHEYAVFTHDLDFGAILAVTHAEKPSVIQIRTQEVLPEFLGSRMIEVLGQYEGLLEEGALIIVDENASRVRILPLNRQVRVIFSAGADGCLVVPADFKSVAAARERRWVGSIPTRSRQIVSV